MRKLLLMLILFCQLIYAAPTIIPVGPVGDADCQFNTIQEAIDSGLLEMDIRLSNQLITNSSVDILRPGVLYLRGGYANCQDAIDGVIDVLNPLTAIDRPIFILNVDRVDFENAINIENIILDNLPMFDLGIKVNAFSNNLTVNLNHVRISNNTGHGLLVRGGAVVNLDNVEIYHNAAQQLGGGIECVDAYLNINENVSIHHNFAPTGGGLYVYNCEFTLRAGDSNPLNSLEYGVFSNIANEGAGIYIRESRSVQMIGSTIHPVSIVNNGDNTTLKGGGLFVGDNSVVQIVNLRLEDNVSEVSGGGIYQTKVSTNINDFAGIIQIFRHPDGCFYSEICNSLSFNQTLGVVNDGALAYLDNGSILYINQSVIKDNAALNSNLFKVKGASELKFISDLIVHNDNAIELVNQEDNSIVQMDYCTLADNQFDNYFNVLYDNNNAQTLFVRGTIIKNGAATLANLNNDIGDHDAQIICSLVENNDATGVVQNASIIGIPTFVGSGSYKLQENSLGLNSTCMNFTHTSYIRYDILNTNRATSPTPDLGAYQMGFLFHDGFE